MATSLPFIIGSRKVMTIILKKSRNRSTNILFRDMNINAKEGAKENVKSS